MENALLVTLPGEKDRRFEEAGEIQNNTECDGFSGAGVILLVRNVVFDDDESKKLYGIRELSSWFRHVRDFAGLLDR